jgi:hypothetical protein
MVYMTSLVQKLGCHWAHPEETLFLYSCKGPIFFGAILVVNVESGRVE